MTKKQIAILVGLGLSVLCVFFVLGYLVVDKVSITSDGVSVSLAITPRPPTTLTPTVAKRPWVATPKTKPKPTATPTLEIPSWPTPVASLILHGTPQNVSYVLNYVPHSSDGLTIGQRMMLFWGYYQVQGYDMQSIKVGDVYWGPNQTQVPEWEFHRKMGSDNLVIITWRFYMNGELTTVEWWFNTDTNRIGPNNSLARFIYD